MQWTEEAESYFNKVPPFVRPMVRKGVETYVRSQGFATVTTDLIRQAKARMMGNNPVDGEQPENRGEFNRETSRLHSGVSQFFAKEGVDPLPYAFDRKTAVHAGAGGLYLEKDQVMAAWNMCSADPDQNKRRTVYIHTPFCRSHCRFCGFYMYKIEDDSSRAYTTALLQEIKQSAELAAVREQPVQAVYFGGGTPTDLEAEDLERLLAGIHEYLPLANDCEITVEGRVSHFTPAKIAACIRGGANRFSLGVQSFHTEVRRQMGRRAERHEVLSLLAKLTDQNQASVVIDLIYGFPNQTMEIWQDDVRTFLEETELDGCDMYQLNVFRGGPLATAIDEGRIAPVADIPAQAAMFSMGRAMALNARLRRLSMCHWGRTSRERNRYNSFTRYGATCIPFGCGAGGRLGGHSFFQEGGLKEYYRRVQEGEKPIATAVRMSPHSPMFSELVAKIEEGAVNLPALGSRYDIDLPEVFHPLLSQWAKTGLLVMDNGWLELTEAGEFWQVTMAQALLDYFLIVHNGEKNENS
jgi:oxygen-independent coproporphyrinogen-3 oxidase